MQPGSHRPLTARSASGIVGLRASQRMLAQAVQGMCASLLRMGQGAQFVAVTAAMQELIGRRGELLRELHTGIRSAAELSCVEA